MNFCIPYFVTREPEAYIVSVMIINFYKSIFFSILQRTMRHTVSLDIFSIVDIDSLTASSSSGLIVANSSCSLATSSAVVNNWKQITLHIGVLFQFQNPRQDCIHRFATEQNRTKQNFITIKLRPYADGVRA